MRERILASLRRHPEMTLFLTLALGYRSDKLRTGRVALAALAMAVAAAGVYAQERPPIRFDNWLYLQRSTASGSYRSMSSPSSGSASVSSSPSAVPTAW
jgi:hypothetical protein